MTNRIAAALSFSEDEGRPLSDLPHPSMPSSVLRNLVAKVGKPSVYVALLATASGDSDHDVATFYRRMSQLNCHACDLSVTRFNYDNIEKLVNGQDIFYISDGSGPNLAAVWRSNNLDKLIVRAAQRSVKLYAENEGASVLFESYDSRARGCVEIFQDGLGIIPGTLIRHSIEQNFTDWGLPEPIYFVHPLVAIEFRPGVPPCVVSSGPEGEAWFCDSRSESRIRTRLPVDHW